ncbi:hypothetical protein DERP_002739 [Dermatophagoides pteronyssinus]|uniref:Uncharacterized protein n=1 Tax=Dermatophagoides pteronyssinus TaxID=6956 RepID=A0ABQ8JW49_DERPT|nr:hypothetical protein DERP_002739 [Dermatophagoides pteronyssinus]
MFSLLYSVVFYFRGSQIISERIGYSGKDYFCGYLFYSSLRLFIVVIVVKYNWNERTFIDQISIRQK